VDLAYARPLKKGVRAMAMNRLFLLVFLLFSSIALATEPYSEIQEHIYKGLESGNMDHESWYTAAKLLNKPLAENIPWANYYAAYLYAFGAGGFPIDYTKADMLETSAANEGFLPAMVAQARRYEHGLSGTIDLAIAYSWYKKKQPCLDLVQRRNDKKRHTPKES
jgi:TPR repeat protein